LQVVSRCKEHQKWGNEMELIRDWRHSANELEDALGCCDAFAIEHPGARFCPTCLLANERPNIHTE
jgi:hypothetical protein